jgi:enoyl-[acyl-carrier protein] reductase II
MKTRVTELFGIEHPILLSGMSWISTPRLVAAVSNAGGLGILATGVYNPEQTRKAIREVRELTDRPFGANATLYFPGARENAQVLLEEKVPLINFSMGKGDWIVEGAHRYGGKVIATVTTAKHAQSAASYGTDALLVTGNEAAGHGAGVSSLVLIQRIREAVDLPLVAAGGFATGRALLAALVLGADGIAMGTRFMNTQESPAHDACKAASRQAEAEETLYTTRFDGQPCRILLSEGARKAVKRGLDLKRAAFNGIEISRMLGVPYPKMALGILAQGWKTTRQLAHLANAFKGFRLSCTEGDLRRGVLPLGQVTALIHDTPTVAEVIQRIVKEAEEEARSLPGRVL